MQSYLGFRKSFFRVVPWFIRKWVRVKGQLEFIIISDPTAKMDDVNENRQMTLKNYVYPTRSTQPFYITLSALTVNFEIKSGMIQMILVFQGLTNENSYQHVREFEDICRTMKYNQMTKESLKLRLFPFFLKEKVKA